MSILETLLLVTMMISITRAKEFFAKLKQEHNRVFTKGLAKTSTESATLTKVQVKFFKTDKKDRDLLRSFHKEVIESDFEALGC